MKNFKPELKWAMVFAAVMLLWMITEHLFGLHDTRIHLQETVSYFFMIPAIAVFVFALRDIKKKKYQGNMNLMDGFLSGLVMTFFITFLSMIIQVILVKIISPHYFENAINYTLATHKMELADAQDYFNLKTYVIQVLLSTPIMGAVTSLIISFFLRTKKQ